MSYVRTLVRYVRTQRTCVCAYVRTRTYARVRTYTHVRTQVCATRTYAHVRTCTYVHTRTYAYVRTHILAAQVRARVRVVFTSPHNQVAKQLVHKLLRNLQRKSQRHAQERTARDEDERTCSASYEVSFGDLVICSASSSSPALAVRSQGSSLPKQSLFPKEKERSEGTAAADWWGRKEIARSSAAWAFTCDDRRSLRAHTLRAEGTQGSAAPAHTSLL